MTRSSRAPAKPSIELATSRQALPSSCDPVSRRLGGVTVWAPTPVKLERGIDQLSDAIDECASAHLSITKAVLRKLVRERLPACKIEDRLFSAVLGSTLRSGLLDAIVCASENDKPYRVLIHRAQLPRFAEATKTAITMLRRNGTIAVPLLEKAIFGNRSYNTWSSTAHVLARLSYLGLAQLGEEGRCSIVAEVT